jgi:hypothetical protein
VYFLLDLVFLRVARDEGLQTQRPWSSAARANP